MPPIKEISSADGIKIDCEGLASYWLKLVDFPKTQSWITPEAYGGILTDLIQPQYEQKFLVSSLSSDYHDGLTQLLPNERIEKIQGKDYLVITTMFVQVHIYSLSPLKYTIRCSDEPITGEWW